jgi:hypothetical protein
MKRQSVTLQIMTAALERAAQVTSILSPPAQWRFYSSSAHNKSDAHFGAAPTVSV